MNADTKEGIDRFVNYGTPPSSFLRAVLSNDLSMSFMKADLENQRDMYEIVCYVHNAVPSNCWGSLEKFQAWIDKKELERIEEAAKLLCKGCNKKIKSSEFMSSGFCKDCHRD